VRLKDVDEAQMRMVNVAKDLANKGEIMIANKQGEDELVYDEQRPILQQFTFDTEFRVEGDLVSNAARARQRKVYARKISTTCSPRRVLKAPRRAWFAPPKRLRRRRRPWLARCVWRLSRPTPSRDHASGRGDDCVRRCP